MPDRGMPTTPASTGGICSTILRVASMSWLVVTQRQGSRRAYSGFRWGAAVSKTNSVGGDGVLRRSVPSKTSAVAGHITRLPLTSAIFRACFDTIPRTMWQPESPSKPGLSQPPDHGENLGEHGLWWKNSMYEHAARVPLIISWPARWKGGQRRVGASSMVDLVQTIADLGGAKVPGDWNGTSLCRWMDDPATASRTWPSPSITPTTSPRASPCSAAAGTSTSTIRRPTRRPSPAGALRPGGRPRRVYEPGRPAAAPGDGPAAARGPGERTRRGPGRHRAAVPVGFG